MTATATTTWAQDNQRYLSLALSRLSEVIAAGPEAPAAAPDEQDALAARMTRPPALTALTSAFGLSPFERDLLLMCAGLELDAAFQHTVHTAAGADGHDWTPSTQPTFSHALALLPGAHWSALAPSAPLRRWHLIELTPTGTLTQTPLRAAERALHFLVGVATIDVEIEGLVALVDGSDAGRSIDLPASHAELADRAVRAFTSAAPLGTIPVVQLVGRADSAREIAAAVAGGLGFGLAVMHVDDLPSGAREREQLARLWEREAVLSSLLLLVDGDALGDEQRAAAGLARFLDLLASPTLSLTRRDARHRQGGRPAPRAATQPARAAGGVAGGVAQC